MSLFGDLLGSLAVLPKGRSCRISSNEQPNWDNGNSDSTPLPPGRVFELPVLEGPGVINHIWFTSHAGGVTPNLPSPVQGYKVRIYMPGFDVAAVSRADTVKCGHFSPSGVCYLHFS